LTILAVPVLDASTWSRCARRKRNAEPHEAHGILLEGISMSQHASDRMPNNGTVTRRGFGLGLAAFASLVLSGQRLRAFEDTRAVSGVDTHAHIFKRGLKLADVRRYAPDYDATIDDYLKVLDANGLSHGVLVQPSFLGTDNTYLLEGLQAARGRARGIAVVPPTISRAELNTLNEAGIVGIRLNLVGLPIPAFDAEPWPALLKNVAELNWQVEVHREARDLEGIVAPLLKAGVDVVVDHFGRPDGKLGVDDPGFRYLLTTGPQRRTWVKISAPYRNGNDGAGEATALKAYPMLRDSLGVDRLLWGSDWPHTQFEKTQSFASNRALLDQMVTDAGERQQILTANPGLLFRLEVAYTSQTR
jgi:predicted TIM-barrel fold metal-dependent hydrolase